MHGTGPTHDQRTRSVINVVMSAKLPYKKTYGGASSKRKVRHGSALPLSSQFLPFSGIFIVCLQCFMSSMRLLLLLVLSAWDSIIFAIIGNTPPLLVLLLFLLLPTWLSALTIFYHFLLIVLPSPDSLLIVLHLLSFSSTPSTSFSLPSTSSTFSSDLCARRLKISMQLLPPSTSPDPHYLAAFSPGVTPAFVYSVTPS